MNRPQTIFASLIVTAACSSQTGTVATGDKPAATSSDGGAEASPSRLSSGVAWVGDTHLRYDGWRIEPRTVMSQRALEIVTETWPMGRATEVLLFWKVGGAVSSLAMSDATESAGAEGRNTQWRATIPADILARERPVEYWIRARDAAGNVVWDSNDGRNYDLTPHDRVTLFDGTSSGWRMAGNGTFAIEPSPSGPILVAHPQAGLGLFWSTFPIPESFELSLDFQLSDPNDNSGVFLRFPDPDAFGYDNTAWVGVNYGLEVQIDETARPDGAGVHRTGAIYGQAGQTLTPRSAKPAGQWSRYVIRVVGQTYSVQLDGHEVSRLAWSNDAGEPLRALPGGSGSPRFVGLQSHTGLVAFRDIRLEVL